MATTFHVQPQRSDGRAFIPCPIHQATSFAVVRVDTGTRKGKPYRVTHVIAHFATKTQAEGLARANTKAFTPTPRHLVRKLGKRIIAP